MRFLVLLAATLIAVPVAAQEISCDNTSEYPCGYQLRNIELQKVPPIFKFQSRVSQAKLPIGEGLFQTVLVKVLRGTKVLCVEEFKSVQVVNSVLNLEIGQNMSCEIDSVIAENTDLAFQICLGGPESCLKPIELAATPYAVKASYATIAQQAHNANTAGQAHYAHRLTADRDLFLRKKLGTGYFDFYTHAVKAATGLYTEEEYQEFEDGGFIQWTPVRNRDAKTVVVSAKDQDTDKLGFLDKIMIWTTDLVSQGNVTINPPQNGTGLTVTAAGAHVTGNSDVDGKLLVTQATTVASGGIHVTHDSDIDGKLVVTQSTTVQSGGIHVTDDSDIDGNVTITKSTTVQSGGIHVKDDSDIDGNVVITKSTTVESGGTHVTGNSNFDDELLVSKQVTVESGGTHVTGNSNFNDELLVSKQVTVESGGTHVTGNSNFDDELVVSKRTTVQSGGIHVTGNSKVTGNLTVSNGEIIQAGGTTVQAGGSHVTGDSDIDGTLTTTKAVIVQSGGTQVTGDSNVAGTVTTTKQINVLSGGVQVTGASKIDGTLTTTEALNVHSGGAQVIGDSNITGTLTTTDTLTTKDIVMNNMPYPTLKMAKTDGSGVDQVIRSTTAGEDTLTLLINGAKAWAQTIIEQHLKVVGSIYAAGSLHADDPGFLNGKKTDGTYAGVAHRNGADELYINPAGGFADHTVVDSNMTVNKNVTVAGSVVTKGNFTAENSGFLNGKKADGSVAGIIHRDGEDTLHINVGKKFNNHTIIDSILTVTDVIHLLGKISIDDPGFLNGKKSDGTYAGIAHRDGADQLHINPGGGFANKTIVDSQLAVTKGASVGGTLTVQGDLVVSGEVTQGVAETVSLKKNDGSTGVAMDINNNNRLVINPGPNLLSTVVDGAMNVMDSLYAKDVTSTGSISTGGELYMEHGRSLRMRHAAGGTFGLALGTNPDNTLIINRSGTLNDYTVVESNLVATGKLQTNGDIYIKGSSGASGYANLWMRQHNSGSWLNTLRSSYNGSNLALHINGLNHYDEIYMRKKVTVQDNLHVNGAITTDSGNVEVLGALRASEYVASNKSFQLPNQSGSWVDILYSNSNWLKMNKAGKFDGVQVESPFQVMGYLSLESNTYMRPPGKGNGVAFNITTYPGQQMIINDKKSVASQVTVDSKLQVNGELYLGNSSYTNVWMRTFNNSKYARVMRASCDDGCNEDSDSGLLINPNGEFGYTWLAGTRVGVSNDLHVEGHITSIKVGGIFHADSKNGAAVNGKHVIPTGHSTTTSLCTLMLNEIHDNNGGGYDYCRVIDDNNNGQWDLIAYSSANGRAVCQARCLTW